MKVQFSRLVREQNNMQGCFSFSTLLQYKQSKQMHTKCTFIILKRTITIRYNIWYTYKRTKSTDI